jgi:hypothetical protein
MFLSPRYLKQYTFKFTQLKCGPDSAGGIEPSNGLEGPVIDSGGGAKFSAPDNTGPGAHPASYTMGTGFIPGVKQPGRDADHQPYLAPRSKKE